MTTKQSTQYNQHLVFTVIYGFLAILTHYILQKGFSAPLVLDSIKLNSIKELVAREGWDVFKSLPHTGIFGRTISVASFSLQFQFPGFSSNIHLRQVNYAIHISNSLLVYILVKKIVSYLYPTNTAFKIAVITTALWFVAPINLNPVMYTIQRMTLLSSFFILASIILYIQAREDLISRNVIGVSINTFFLVVCTVAALTAKETGISFFYYALLIEASIFRFKTIEKAKKLSYFGLIVSILILFYISTSTNLISYADKSFTLAERILTQPRIIFSYISHALLPLDSSIGLYYDSFKKSKDLLTPVNTILSILGILGITAACFKKSQLPTIRVAALGWLFFLAGHLLESTFLPLELYFLHRNYIPTVGIFLVIAMSLHLIFQKRYLVLVAIIAVSFLLFIDHKKANTWQTQESIIFTALKTKPESRRATMEAANFFLTQNDPLTANALLTKHIKKHSDRIDTALVLQRFYTNCLINKVTPNDYQTLEKSTAYNKNEVGQALDNLHDLYTNQKCPSLDPLRFIDTLNRLPDPIKNSWHVTYYIYEFQLSSNQVDAAKKTLISSLLKGNISAGAVLLMDKSKLSLDQQEVDKALNIMNNKFRKSEVDKLLSTLKN